MPPGDVTGPGRPVTVAGTLAVPGDKSISHRALIHAALASGRSRIRGLLDSADVRSTAGVLRATGVAIPDLAAEVVIHGNGLRSLRPSPGPLDCGNSGTTTRLMAGVLAAHPFSSRFVGDSSLSRRPMRRVARPLEAMGARVELDGGDGLPMTVHGGALHGIAWTPSPPSAQVKSAILYAAAVAGVEVRVTETVQTRDHTERMLAAHGIMIHRAGPTITLRPAAELQPIDLEVPGDPSSAAFFVALAVLADSAGLDLRGVCTNPTRTAFLTALQRMGASIEQTERRDMGGEPTATLRPRAARLRGITVTPDEAPRMIDELPLLACVAARAEGETVIRGASELRTKESDRISTVVRNLRAVGAIAEELDDGMRITGTDRPLRGQVVTMGDHRIAMAFAVLGAASGNGVVVDDPACVAVSYPTFWSDLRRVTA